MRVEEANSISRGGKGPIILVQLFYRGSTWKLLAVAIFFGMLFLPLFVFFHAGDSSEGTEFRTLAKRPEFSREAFLTGTFQRKYADYLRDHFGFRTAFIQFHNRLKNGLFGDSAVSGVILGRKDWLFYSKKGLVQYSTENTGYPTPDQARLKSNFTKLGNDFKARKIPLFLAVAPNKEAIYSEFLPAWYRARFRQNPRLENFLSSAASSQGLFSVGFHEFLLLSKAQGQLYHKTDTHWNGLGGALATIHLLNELRKVDSRIPAATLADFTKKIEGRPGDLGRMIADDYFRVENDVRYSLEGHPTPEKSESVGRMNIYHNAKAVGAPRILLYCDSFGSEITQHLIRLFKNVCFGEPKTNWYLSRIMLEKCQPDIAISLFVERRLMGHVDQLSRYVEDVASEGVDTD